jgi:hypothetical protein
MLAHVDTNSFQDEIAELQRTSFPAYFPDQSWVV